MSSHAAKIWLKVFTILFQIISTYCAIFTEKYGNCSLNIFLITVLMKNLTKFWKKKTGPFHMTKQGLAILNLHCLKSCKIRNIF